MSYEVKGSPETKKKNNNRKITIEPPAALSSTEPRAKMNSLVDNVHFSIKEYENEESEYASKQSQDASPISKTRNDIESPKK